MIRSRGKTARVSSNPALICRDACAPPINTADNPGQAGEPAARADPIQGLGSVHHRVSGRSASCPERW